MLSHGINFIPAHCRGESEMKCCIEADLREVAINYFRDRNSKYPTVDTKCSLKSVIQQLLQQSLSCSNDVVFYSTLYEE